MMDSTQKIVSAEADRMAALQMQMLEMHPFWGYLLLQVKLVPALRLPAYAATDCIRHIWYNPLLTQDLSAKKLGFVLAHEVCHQLLETASRRYGREQYKWNMATDYAINALVSDITIPGEASSKWTDYHLYQMPDGVLFDPVYHDWIAEAIYEDLCLWKMKNAPRKVEVTLPRQNGEVRLSDISDHGGGIDIHLPLELDDTQREILQQRIAAAVEVYHTSDERGDFPGGMLRHTGIFDPPKIPWQRILHRYADTILNGDDYSLARPNKRYWSQDLVVPGHYGESIANLVVALDTSGSMTEEDIREVAKEIRGMVANAQSVTLIVADCEIRQVVPLDELEELLRSGAFRGGGGTNHICVFDYIARHRLNPRLFIGLTDLYSTFPEKKPPYPVLWLVTKYHADPPWGKVIEL